MVYVILLNGFIFGTYCSYLAVKKGYSSISWFFAGFFFGIITLIAITDSPIRGEEVNSLLKECSNCREMNRINTNICKYCGYRFTKEEKEETQKKMIKTCSRYIGGYTLGIIRNLIDLGMTDTLINELLRIFKGREYPIYFIQEVGDLVIEKGDKRIIPPLENLLKDLKNKKVVEIVKNIIEKLK